MGDRFNRQLNGRTRNNQFGEPRMKKRKECENLGETLQQSLPRAEDVNTHPNKCKSATPKRKVTAFYGNFSVGGACETLVREVIAQKWHTTPTLFERSLSSNPSGNDAPFPSLLLLSWFSLSTFISR